MRLRTLLGAALAAAAFCLPARAAEPDLAGAQDHPVVKRFAGSRLVGYYHSDWTQTFMPTGNKVRDEKWQDPVTLEGKVTRIVYLAPRGKTPLEVYRNYEQALQAAGFKRRFACEAECQDLYFAMNKTLEHRSSLRWADGYILKNGDPHSQYSMGNALSFDGRLLYGTLGPAGSETHLLLYVSSAGTTGNDVAGVLLQIVEPKAMATGQVTVNLAGLQQALAAEGKVALYGLYFDTGKAEIKPESKPQLEEMAKLLRAQPALKVFVVGHTDNQGAVEHNLALSQQRAQAVSLALTKDYQIDAKRLSPRGVANLAPVASNGDDAGRARNRRVELVVQ